MARGIKLDRPLLTQEQWFALAYDGLLWLQEGADDEWDASLIRQTRRLGKRRIEKWLCDDSVSFNDYEAGLALAEHCGLT